MDQVLVRREPVKLLTYTPAAPDKNPMFLEKRVYQGSNGQVYPLPFYNRIEEKPAMQEWDAVHIENDSIYVMILPQLGGRIHILRDKTNGYDAIYNQSVIKPALVGLSGPWASGGIEFNWPQHHRPATYMPVEVAIESYDDGSATVWLSDHDPLLRLKGMHGVCLHPGRAYLELKVRAYNRTPYTQTFLWWANVATRVHEAYQSFFPPDVTHIADHARRATSEYPLCQGSYYGVDYHNRAQHGIPEHERPAQFPPRHHASSSAKFPRYAPNDLSWYANIPVPTSYMCLGSKEDFVGAYDYKAQAGLLHIANHHIAPGKKQWTWGNHAFGYAWDRNLTEPDATGEYAPYIELMAGVYTDNQPDFSFLQPGETKTWSQFWYPYQKIGTAQHANLDAALHLHCGKNQIHLGVTTTRDFPQARIILTAGTKTLFDRTVDLAPASAFTQSCTLQKKIAPETLTLRVITQDGHSLIHYSPKPQPRISPPAHATEPPAPRDITSADELFTTGLHLRQYSHATRCPTLYWKEALRRDSGDSRCNNAMGLWHLRRGEFTLAEPYFRRAIERLTRRNPNPYDGEPYYNLGLCLRSLQRDDDAYDAIYKSVWNHAWQPAGYHALAEIDCTRHDWLRTLDHLDRALRGNADNLRARNLRALVLRQLDRTHEADQCLAETLALDPLDIWARHLRDNHLPHDTQLALDLAHDYTRAGFHAEAIAVLESKTESPDPGTAPILHYTLGWLHEKLGQTDRARAARDLACRATTDYGFPSRLEEIAILQSAIAANPRDARAPYYLSNLFYDRHRHREAIALWQRAVRLEPANAIAWRNLGIGFYNILHAPAKARAAYEKALRANPDDARLLYERDQLWKRLRVSPSKRLAALLARPDLIRQRDDLSLELTALYNQTGRSEEAEKLLQSRRFQPWEGGEGLALGQHLRTQLQLGRQALAAGQFVVAQVHFTSALNPPENLGEAWHLLANPSDIHYHLGLAAAALGDKAKARQHWTTAATFKGDFQNMSVRAFSEMTYYSALAWEKLGQKARAKKKLRDLLAYARQLRKTKATIDYFATSLPTMLLFDEDLQERQTTTALFLEAQAFTGLGRMTEARKALRLVLRRDPNHALAQDLATMTPF
ncbi:MAG: DUF5107 domain-containing protein [Verrucomicrobia bacterium Tous-C9LFEB]|nr:MAG: DUF5107 domain-containing protein [Verrucomicrobia bacterium Tous-C9LFEB]